MNSTGELIAIGGAYVDINAPNFPLGEEGLQLETEIVGQEYQVEPGGSAVNFARLCAALEIPTTFIGKIGRDELGDTLSRLLVESQVSPSLIVSESAATNIGFNMIHTNGKSIMAVVGTANQALTADEVYSKASEKLTAGSYLFLGGCFKLKKLMPAFVQLATDAKTAGAKVALDHGRITNNASEEDKETMRQLALSVDFYLPSADEFIQLWNVPSIEEGLVQLSQKTTGIVVVKNSDQGAVTLLGGKVITVPAHDVSPIHTIGAGDSFDAGFIAAQYRGEDLLASIQFGCATAALKISRDSLPTADDVRNLIAHTNP